MEYLQYSEFTDKAKDGFDIGFKPYYKWNTFNTLDLYKDIDFVVS